MSASDKHNDYNYKHINSHSPRAPFLDLLRPNIASKFISPKPQQCTARNGFWMTLKSDFNSTHGGKAIALIEWINWMYASYPVSWALCKSGLDGV